jgi:hypothetical protein
MKRTRQLLRRLPDDHYLYAKNRQTGMGYVLERNVPPSEDSEKAFRLSVLGKGGSILECQYFDLGDSGTVLSPLRRLPLNLLRKYWS